MHRSGVFLLLFLTSCGQAPPPQVSPVEDVRSAHALTILDAQSEPQTLLIAGTRAPDDEVAPEAAREARAALDQLLAHGQVTHSPAGEPDRYSRTPSQVTLGNGDDLGRVMVERGWLMVWPRLGQEADFPLLYAAEANAREAQAGAWARGDFAVRDTDPNRLAQRLDSAQIIEGRVISTGTARDGRVFVNFGLDWRTDFTAVADGDAAARFVEAGVDLRALEGTVIRVRGWLYELNGPSLALQHPAQIELVDAPTARELPR